MREEPVLYINGKPYVVREANKPFANLEYTGLSYAQSIFMHFQKGSNGTRLASFGNIGPASYSGRLLWGSFLVIPEIDNILPAV